MPSRPERAARSARAATSVKGLLPALAAVDLAQAAGLVEPERGSVGAVDPQVSAAQAVLAERGEGGEQEPAAETAAASRAQDGEVSDVALALAALAQHAAGHRPAVGDDVREVRGERRALEHLV